MCVAVIHTCTHALAVKRNFPETSLASLVQSISNSFNRNGIQNFDICVNSVAISKELIIVTCQRQQDISQLISVSFTWKGKEIKYYHFREKYWYSLYQTLKNSVWFHNLFAAILVSATQLLLLVTVVTENAAT